MVDGCCRKGSRNALQELYNPTQVGSECTLSLFPSLSDWHLFLFVLSPSPMQLSEVRPNKDLRGTDPSWHQFSSSFIMSACAQACFLASLNPKQGLLACLYRP